ncbi:signal recognition particle-docking protein FtsY [Candidatus Woesearchaeota archaeon]|nr:signal recognition particle-docking protein FtsY [Candidatus Woesearchaeota archaeon]
MFKFLKEKIKKSVESISEKLRKDKEVIEESKEIVKTEERHVEPVEEKISEATEEIPKVEKKPEEPVGGPKVEEAKKWPEAKEEKKGFFQKIKEKVISTTISEEKFEELFQELEMGLLENNVAYDVIDKLKDDLKKNLVDKPIKRGKIEETIFESLKKSLKEILLEPEKDLVKLVSEKQEKPFVIVFFGINGSGKTTSIAKIAYHLKNENLKPLLVAGDTFRAAAIEQLQEWSDKLNIPIVKQKYKSDPAAVGFDGISMAKARNFDVVLMDTAGRLHSNEDLIREMEKIVRVTKPDLKLFVAESITGNDAVLQAREFDKKIGIDGIILTKSDVDEKGGAAISISYITKKPVYYIGIGQLESDLKPFNKDIILESLNLK